MSSRYFVYRILLLLDAAEQVREMSNASVIISLSFPLNAKTTTLETIIQNLETPILFQRPSSFLSVKMNVDNVISADSTVKSSMQIGKKETKCFNTTCTHFFFHACSHSGIHNSIIPSEHTLVLQNVRFS